MTYPTLYLLRHGQTDWNRDRRVQGQLESALTEVGQEHARAQGRILGRLGVPQEIECRVSPQVRTRQTAAIAVEPLGVVPVFDARLKEVFLGPWEGQYYDDLIAAAPDTIGRMTVFEMCMNGPGETVDDMWARGQAMLEELRGPTVIVSHGIMLTILRGIVMGLDMAGMAALDRGQGTVSVVESGREVILHDA